MPPIEDPVVETPAPTPAPEPEDRGDVVTVEAGDDEQVSAESLAAVVAAAPPEPTPAPTPAPEAHDKQQGIPKARFDEVNEERKQTKADLEAARARIAELEAGKPAATPAPTPPPFDEDAKEAEYTEALMEGDTKKAVALRKEINAHVRMQAEAAAEARYNQRQAETAQQAAARALNAASTQAITDFPYLDTEEGAEALELIVASRDRKIANGIAPGEALRQAVAVIAPKFKPADAQAPAAAAAPAADQRAADALKRGAADSVKQPPAMAAGMGNRATAGKVDVANMTDEEFDALPMSEKRRLRGDA